MPGQLGTLNPRTALLSAVHCVCCQTVKHKLAEIKTELAVGRTFVDKCLELHRSVAANRQRNRFFSQGFPECVRVCLLEWGIEVIWCSEWKGGDLC